MASVTTAPVGERACPTSTLCLTMNNRKVMAGFGQRSLCKELLHLYQEQGSLLTPALRYRLLNGSRGSSSNLYNLADGKYTRRCDK